jgi:hypothetical protein
VSSVEATWIAAIGYLSFVAYICGA